MTEDKSTPRPWFARKIGDEYLVFDDQDRPIIRVLDEDRARLIVTAVNSHEAAMRCVEAARQYVLGKAPDGKALLAALSAYDAVKEG